MVILGTVASSYQVNIPANPTFEPLASTTLTSSAANITFSNISNAYTDLYIVASLSTNGAQNYRGVLMQFNNDSANHNYRAGYWEGTGTGGGTTAESNAGYWYFWENGKAPSNSIFGNSTIYISNYTRTNHPKSGIVDSATEAQAQGMAMGLIAGFYNSTSAISSIKFTPSVPEDFAQHSTITIYGIKNS